MDFAFHSPYSGGEIALSPGWAMDFSLLSIRASALLSSAAPTAAPPWALETLAGRLVELSGRGASARLTGAFGLVLEAQRQGEVPAWITFRDSSFFPPDVAAGGVDLTALAVIRVPEVRAAGRAADQLVRSGAFGLVIVDLASRGKSDERLAPPILTRLMGLAQKHDTAVVFLTEKPTQAPSLSSLVSLRAEARRTSRGNVIDVHVHILKDKRRAPGGEQHETCHGPAGLR
jgi:recombination protein RecA